LVWTEVTTFHLNSSGATYVARISGAPWEPFYAILQIGSFAVAILFANKTLARASAAAASGLIVETLTVGVFFTFIGTIAYTLFSHGL
jgi:hypothetical protein